MILDSLPQHIKRAARLFLPPFSAEFQHSPATELKILLITVLFLGASAAFSLQEEQEGKRVKLFRLAFSHACIFDLEFSHISYLPFSADAPNEYEGEFTTSLFDLLSLVYPRFNIIPSSITKYVSLARYAGQ